MDTFALSCSSTADLTQAHYARKGIYVVPAPFQIGGVSYLDGVDGAPSGAEFYQMMIDGADTATSQPSAGFLEEHFSHIIETQGIDVLHVTLSSGISGEINAATLAAAAVEESHPGYKVRVVDSLCASSGYGLLMDEAATKRDAGLGIEEVATWMEQNRGFIHHWFFSTDLTWYVKGGRVSKTAGIVGGALKICPILDVDKEGKLQPVKNIRSKKKAMRAAVDAMHEHAQGGESYSGKCYVCHSNFPKDAKQLADMVASEFPNIDGEVEINDIGPTIGAHSGPGTAAVFFWGGERV